MIRCNRGDVVLVEFPFSEQDRIKKRPALVLSSDSYHQGREEIILAAVTSNTARILVADTLVQDWKEAGLLFPSTVSGIIQTIKADMITKKLGTLSHRDMKQVMQHVKHAMGF
ncbi:MAG: type II toxin-antitoxin system PemK/MazF family toxin [Candidatus Omnitrophica bacterium]|nr:type II toxin-antitoxin system PemK/MazF family toxin [Candidatus Omnitrophota bacterium]